MHLAIVSPFPPATTGIGQYGYHLGRALARSGGFDCITLLTGKSSNGHEVQISENMHVEQVWTPEGIDAGPRVVARLRSLRPDIVWYNLGSTAFGRSPLANFSGIMSPALGRSMGLVTVVTIHEMAEWADLAALGFANNPLMVLGTKLVTQMLTQADLVCTTLRCHGQWLSRRKPGLHWVHIPIGAYGRPELLPGSDPGELLLFTSLAPYKGLEQLLHSFHALRGRYPELKLTIAGTEHGRFPGYFEKVRAAFTGLQGVRWLGHVPEEQIKSLFQRAAIIVLPYTATTGSSSVLYQAARWGRPVVSSNLPELSAAAAESGLEVELYDNRQIDGLTVALDNLLRQPERCASMVEHNLKSVAHMDLGDTSAAYLRAFNNALALRRSPKRISVPGAARQESSS